MRKSLTFLAIGLITSIVITGCDDQSQTRSDSREVGISDREVGISDREVGISDREVGISDLEVGISDLEDIKRVFGEPENLRKGVQWYEVAENRFEVSASRGTERTMYYAEYPSKGLSFSFFTNPSRLFDITVTKKELPIRGIRIGDTLVSVRETLGEQGEWRTSDAQEWWWLRFENLGLKVGFERDQDQEKYPINLAKPELSTRINVFDNRVSFY